MSLWFTTVNTVPIVLTLTFIYSYTFWVRIVDSSTGEEDSYEEMKVKVNTIGTVFTVVNHNDISSVTHSFSLSDVIHENERIDQGRCCEGISEIRDGL
jgi:hypothetical protein